MRKIIKLRELTVDEVTEIIRLANSNNGSNRLVQRARIIAFMLEDSNVSASESGLKAGFTSLVTGPVWVRRFNEKGSAGLVDQPHQGRKPTHHRIVHNQLVNLATQKPNMLGYPFELWTLKHLQLDFKQRYGIHLSVSTIWEWLAAEGYEWKYQQSWLNNTEKHSGSLAKKN